jgi:hypothetical protein
MRYARRFIAIITGIAIWCIATTTSAYALRPDPVSENVAQSPTPTPPPLPGPELWKFVLVAAIAALLTVVVVGMIASLRHARPTRQSPMLNA